MSKLMNHPKARGVVTAIMAVVAVLLFCSYVISENGRQEQRDEAATEVAIQQLESQVDEASTPGDKLDKIVAFSCGYHSVGDGVDVPVEAKAQQLWTKIWGSASRAERHDWESSLRTELTKEHRCYIHSES